MTLSFLGRNSRGLPKAKNYADDRVPRLDELQKIMAYPDWRMKAIVCTMASLGLLFL
jgi:hypothetical protein